MTIQEFIDWLGNSQLLLLIIFCVIPLLAFLGGILQGNRNIKESNFRYFYSALIYLSCIPGMFSAVLTAYSLFFLNNDLLTLNILVYFLPLISMIITLIFIKKKNSFDDIPGFKRISGLMLLMGISFAVAFLISRIVVFVGFIGRLTTLLVFAIVVFVLIKIALSKIKGRKETK